MAGEVVIAEALTKRYRRSGGRPYRHRGRRRRDRRHRAQRIGQDDDNPDAVGLTSRPAAALVAGFDPLPSPLEVKAGSCPIKSVLRPLGPRQPCLRAPRRALALEIDERFAAAIPGRPRRRRTGAGRLFPGHAPAPGLAEILMKRPATRSSTNRRPRSTHSTQNSSR
jgi:hypothetical protein